jgi:hypothetical protein
MNTPKLVHPAHRRNLRSLECYARANRYHYDMHNDRHGGMRTARPWLRLQRCAVDPLRQREEVLLMHGQPTLHNWIFADHDRPLPYR